jgi:two-component system cell cycle sensor histidine kinase/response regulator CckA
MRDSSGTPAELMAEPAPTEPPERRFDPLVWAAGVLFLLAIAFGSAPAWRAGPDTLAGLLLLVGLAGVALLGLMAFRGAVAPVEIEEEGAESFIAALPEAAAVAGADGRVIAANAPWRAAFTGMRRLPRNSHAAPGLFAALARARKGEVARASMKVALEEWPVTVTPMGSGRFLLRLDRAGHEPLRLTAEASLAIPAAAAAAAPQRSRGPMGLDPLAAASPFGAAMLEGEEVFGARIVEANPALAEMTSDKAVAGATFGDLIDPASRIDAGLGAAEGRSGPIEVRLAHDPSRIAHLYLARVNDRLTAYLVDVTEQKQIELQLAQSQKMQAIGQLAAGIAHDFNNLLTAIQLRLDELLERHPLGDPSYGDLSSIKGTAARAADLVRKLKTYSRQETLQREILDLGETISDFEVLLRRLVRENVKLETDYGRNLPLVKVDKGQLEIAVMNLTLNAQDALIAAKGGGKIKLRTARIAAADTAALGYAGPPVGDMAMIEVRDDGPGIPAAVLSKIFDPFFTTKPVGEGTGLGLAQVYGIVKQSDGWIHVESPPGEGATFRIFLPVQAASAVRAPVAPVATLARPRAARDLSGVGRILFVEDEESVRGIAASLLRKRGYEVLEAGDGEEALVLCEQYAGKIDLLISDVMMPGMDGPTLLKKARHHLGDAPVMFISGYAEAEFSDLLEGETGVSFLPKPLDIKTLAERVKQQLQSPAAA